MSESGGLGSLLTGQGAQTGASGSAAAGSQPADGAAAGAAGAEPGSEGAGKTALEQRFSQLTGRNKDLAAENARLRAAAESGGLTNQGESASHGNPLQPVGWSDLPLATVEQIAVEGEGHEKIQATRELSRRSLEAGKAEALKEFRTQSAIEDVTASARTELATRYGEQLSDQSGEFFKAVDAEYMKVASARGEEYAQDPAIVLGICARVEAASVPDLRKRLAEAESKIETLSSGERVSRGPIQVSRDEGVAAALKKGDVRGAIRELPSVKGMR